MPVDVVLLPLLLALEVVVVDFEESMEEVESIVPRGILSRGSNRACSGSLESTISVVELVFPPNKLIFLASATSEERRR